MHALSTAQVINENYYQQFSINSKNNQKEILKKSDFHENAQNFHACKHQLLNVFIQTLFHTMVKKLQKD